VAINTRNRNTYYIWTQKCEVGRLGRVKLLITEKELSDESEELSVKCIVSNKTDAPVSHLIELYAMRWRVETFFRDTKQDLDFGDCELRHVAGASRSDQRNLWTSGRNVLIQSTAKLVDGSIEEISR